MKSFLATIVLFPLFLFSLDARALETDNYITWKLNLADSGDKINQYINSNIEEEIDLANKATNSPGCHELTLKIAERFRTKPPVTHPLEDWLAQNLDEEMLYPKDHNYRLKSIYENPFRFYLRYVKLAPNVQVSGIYFGTDKLSHFVSTGRRYYERYMKKSKKTKDTHALYKDVIRFGLKNEKTFLGTWTSGVFSYADMEANFQGLAFYLGMCQKADNAILIQNNEGKWQKQKTFDIRVYVNPYWDETFNPSYRLRGNWKKTSPSIKKKYCELYQSDLVQERFAHYQRFNHQSFSLDYIRDLQSQKDRLAPDVTATQSFEKLCLSP